MLRLTFLLLLIAPALLGAELPAPRSAHTVSMDPVEPVKAVLQLGDMLKIVLPGDRAHLQSIEVEIKVPAALAALKDAAAYAFYDDAGTELYRAPFPSRVGLNLAVPYGGFVLQPTPYVHILPLKIDDTWAALTMHLAPLPPDRGAEIADALIYVTVKPHLEDRGYLDLAVRLPETRAGPPIPAHAAPFSVYVDEKPAGEGRVPLESGTHHLSIVSDYFRNEVRTFTIERGKASRLEIDLRDINPTVLIVVPDNVEVYLDEKPLAPGAPGLGTIPLTVTQGDHNLRVHISGYELLRTFHAENGRTYKINIRLDLDIQEIR